MVSEMSAVTSRVYKGTALAAMNQLSYREHVRTEVLGPSSALTWELNLLYIETVTLPFPSSRPAGWLPAGSLIV